jgi:hypothetical protein
MITMKHNNFHLVNFIRPDLCGDTTLRAGAARR